MSRYIYFGENVEGYTVPVLNEREARAGAGILFLFAIVSFLNAYLTHRFLFTQIFVTFFMFDFLIRIFINPKYAPSLILGRFFVRNQTPEYVGAAQKRFAWSIGLGLSILMFGIIVIMQWMTSFKILICVICLALLFSEAAFGICLGCILYHIVYKKSPNYCPGDVCEIRQKDEIQKISFLQMFIVMITVIILVFMSIQFGEDNVSVDNSMKCQSGKCGSS